MQPTWRNRPAAQPPEAGIGWRELIEAYQRGPKAEWGPLVIERLAPWLRRVARRFVALPPGLDRHDLWHQLVLEALAVASAIRVPVEPDWTPRMIALRAATAVGRRLRREGAATATEPLTDSVPAAVQVFIGQRPAPYSRLARRGLSVEEETLLHRFHVLGEAPAVLAAEAGVSVWTIRKRLAQARARARELANAEQTTPNANVTPSAARRRRQPVQGRQRAADDTAPTDPALAADR
jgi:hypothetical protein